ncbi:5-(carboxyamino)imidazole ribonucleotide synthase [Flavobacteriales bacterium]|nr:5-(carboxyamino)imidazole ribonucleotide synthase [Flavobacteriales bacterium]
MENIQTGYSLRIGVLGGGQLGLMMIQAAVDLDLRVEVMDPSEKAPCAKFTHRFITGDLNDAEAVYQFGKELDIVTIEIEHVSVEGLRRLEQSGVKVIPKPEHIALIQDKGLQKQFFENNRIPTSDFILIEAEGNISSLGLPIVQKLRTGGYDGRGVQILKTPSDIVEKGFSEACVLEKAVDIDKELGVIVARNSSGQTSIFPVVESVFDPKVNLVSSLIAPAFIDDTTAAKAQALALQVLEAMDFVGLMAVELFLDSDGDLLVNEVAPRTHNSGHHTIEANKTSQFAQHLRAVVGLPLGDVSLLHNAAGMINLLGATGAYGTPVYEGLSEAQSIPGVHPHIYGKSEVKPYRKMGHVTVTGQDLDLVQERLLKLRESLCVSGTKEK